MWKKGELVWVRLNPSDSWTPGRILDPSEPSRILVSFFDLMEPRYFPKSCIRSFERDFETLVADSWRFRHFVDRALQTHFWNISVGLWCSCQPPIDSPYLDTEISLPRSPLSSGSALRFVREMAVSQRVPLRRLAETNSSTAQILSFRRYTVDFNRSESVYEQVIESAKLMDRVEEPDWYLDPSNKMDCVDLVPPMFHETPYPDVGNGRDLSVRDPLPKDIPCCSSDLPVDKLVQSCTMKTMARTSDHEDAQRSKRCHWDQSICLRNSESPIEDIREEDTTSVTSPRVDVSEAPPDVMIQTHDDITGSDDRTATSAKQLSPLLEASNGNAFLAKPVSFVLLEETSTNPRSKLDSSKISANTLDEVRSHRNNCYGTRENSPDDALESHFVDVGQVSPRITGSSNKDKRLADPKCLRMKFLSTYGNLPSKSELLKRFSVFGKIDASRTDVNPGGSSAKVVFLQSIDAMTAYQFAKKIKLGRSKVVYRLDAFEEDMEENKVPLSQKPRQSVPSPRSCLKNHGSVRERRGKKSSQGEISNAD